jgi:GNAT superfamily N-acetyltransferase
MTTTDLDRRLLGPADAATAGDLVARAFHGDPGPILCFPDPSERARQMPAFFTAMAHLALHQGEIHALGDPPVAVVLWFPPGAGDPTPDQLAAAGWDAVAAWDHGAYERLQTLMGHLDAERARLMAEEPYWHLTFFAVTPERQGQGLGSALVRPTIERIRNRGLPVYLESLTEHNARRYERCGFRVIAQGTVPGTDVRVWCMRAG